MNTRITAIHDDIQKLNAVSGFKKIATEHARISKEIQLCMSNINDLRDIINGAFDITPEFDNSANDPEYVPSMITTDEQYNENLILLKNMCETFDEYTNIEDQVQIYLDCINRIKQMDAYMMKQKMEIITMT